MLAAILREMGDVNLDVCDDVELVEMGPDDVAIKITHTGVCHSDVSAMNGTIPQAPPAVLGHEGAGIIEEVGSNVDELAPGDHVIVVWSPSCGNCVYCTGRHQPNLCPNIALAS
ncbi:MAG: alcohol dehydrogenase catalytic domain-containing protein, partial [bacterium]|nr:alcohol dehydrogenase catalytic domain-containing protein [bacterium]